MKQTMDNLAAITTTKNNSILASVFHKLKKPFIVALVAVAFLGIVFSGFLGVEQAYAYRFYPGIFLAGIDLGGKSLSDAQIILQEKTQFLNEQIIDIETGSEKKQLKISDLGISFDLQDSINQAYSQGRQGKYWQKIPKVIASFVSEQNYLLKIQYNDEKFTKTLNDLAGASVKEAKNASLKVEGDNIVTVLAEDGQQIDWQKAKDNLENYFNLPNSAFNLTLNFQQIEPAITEADVMKIKPKIERIINQPIELNYNNRKFIPEKAEIASWIVLKADNEGLVSAVFSDDEIRSYLDFISKKIDKKALPKKVRSDNGEVIEEGNDGLEVDRDDALTKIKTILEMPTILIAGESTVELIVKEVPRKEMSIDPAELVSPGTPGLFEGRYIEINLSEQKMYLWDSSNQIANYTVSTGKWSTPTPTGVRYIEGKSDRAYSAKYNLYMPWWNSLGGGYGIHELPEWANGAKEGESHLGTPVSHGCIRLGVGPAEMVYNWAPEGTPVYIQ